MATGVIAPLVVAALVTLTILTVPPPPRDIGTNGDVSWGAVLSYAHQHQFQFGPQILYTYGPLGFLIQCYYSPLAAGWRLLTDVVISYSAAAALCLVAWRLRAWWRWLLLGWFIFTAANLEGHGDLVFETAFFCWTLLCLTESGNRLRICVWILIVLAAFAGLAKTSFLFIGVLCLALLVADLFLRKEYRLALAVPAGFIGLIPAFWLLAGQNIFNLAGFLAKTPGVVRAYNQAMGWEGPSTASRPGLALALLCLVSVALLGLTSFHAGHLRYRQRRGVLLVWALLFSFAVWKHSFLREDPRHSPFLMAFAPVIMISLASLPAGKSKLRFGAQGLTLAGCLFSLLLLQWLYFASPRHSLKAPFRAAAHDLGILINPSHYQKKMREETQPCLQEAALPHMRPLVGNATADCFGFKQVYLLWNGWNYAPRPVFQSFFACNNELMKLNEQFYLSPAAPRFVLFSLVAVDRRFPPLEDARTLRTLLCNYEPVASEKDFLLLESKASERPRLTLLEEGTVQAGQPIDLRPYGDADLWMEIELNPSWAGKVRQFLYRASMVRLAAYHEAGKGLLLRRRAPPSMMAAGFLASPLLSTTPDVLNLYKGTNIVHPGAYSVEPTPGTGRYWQPNIGFRVFKIENKLGRCLPPDWKGD